MKSFGTAGFWLLMTAGSILQAQTNTRSEKVQFPGGQSAVTLKGQIKGDGDVNYILSAAAGTRWVIDLKAGGSTYFNIKEPGQKDVAFFIGSTSGRKFEGAFQKAGEYTVQVYQMRNAARRGTVSNYTITFTLLPGHEAAAGEAGPAKFNAKGMTKCSAGSAGLGSQCEFRVVRKPGGAAEIWLQNPAAKGKFRVLQFSKGQFTTSDGAKVSSKKDSDTFIVNANGNEYYMIPEAMIFGG
jgi:hypothetical protein